MSRPKVEVSIIVPFICGQARLLAFLGQPRKTFTGTGRSYKFPLVTIGPGLRDAPKGIPRLIAKPKHRVMAIAQRRYRAGWLSNRTAANFQGPCRERPFRAEPFDFSISVKALRGKASTHHNELCRLNKIRPNLWQACRISAVEVHAGGHPFSEN